MSFDPVPDPDHDAAAAVLARAQRVGQACGAVAVPVGIGVFVAGYFVLREVQLRANGVHWPELSAGVALAPALGVGLVGRLVFRLLVRRLAPRWIADEAASRSADPEAVRGILGPWL